MCEKRGARLTEAEDILLRQANPSFLIDGDQVSSRVFAPTRKDDGCLSVDQQRLRTPGESLTFFTSPFPRGLDLASAGVWGVSIDEVHQVELTAWEDPIVGDAAAPANPAHAVIEFPQGSNSDRERRAKRLSVYANARGRLAGPEHH